MRAHRWPLRQIELGGLVSRGEWIDLRKEVTSSHQHVRRDRPVIRGRREQGTVIANAQQGPARSIGPHEMSFNEIEFPGQALR